jgi:hypothetical protein
VRVDVEDKSVPRRDDDIIHVACQIHQCEFLFGLRVVSGGGDSLLFSLCHKNAPIRSDQGSFFS